MAELADALDLGSSGIFRGGSNPPARKTAMITKRNNMEIKVESPQPYLRTISIFFSADEVKERYKRILQQVGENLEIPGFRRGKVPQSIIKQRYGDSISAELAENLANEGFKKALTENEIVPVVEPTLEDELEIEPGNDFSVTISVEVKPPVAIKQFKDIELQKVVEPVEEKEIEDVLEDVRRRGSHLEPIEDRGAQAGDYALVDFKPKDAEKSTKRVLILDDEATKALIDKKPGEKVEGHFEFPENFPEPELRGNIFDAEVEIAELKKEVLPDIDEEFLTQFGEEIKSEEDLRKKIEEDLQKGHENQAENKLREELKNKLISLNPIDLPPKLIENRVKNLLEHYWESKAELVDEEREKIIADLRPRVIQDLSLELILEKIAEDEKIEVSEEDLREHVNSIAVANNLEPQALYDYWKKENRLESVKLEIKDKKTLDYIVENSKVENS